MGEWGSDTRQKFDNLVSVFALTVYHIYFIFGPPPATFMIMCSNKNHIGQ